MPVCPVRRAACSAAYNSGNSQHGYNEVQKINKHAAKLRGVSMSYLTGKPHTIAPELRRVTWLNSNVFPDRQIDQEVLPNVK